jgi:hypothetical protein
MKSKSQDGRSFVQRVPFRGDFVIFHLKLCAANISFLHHPSASSAHIVILPFTGISIKRASIMLCWDGMGCVVLRCDVM